MRAEPGSLARHGSPGHGYGLRLIIARAIAAAHPPETRATQIPTRANRVGLSCERGHAPGQLLQALHELGSVVDDRLRVDLGERYERHSAGSAGADKPTVTFEVCAATPADALQSAGIAAVDLSGVALVVRAQ